MNTRPICNIDLSDLLLWIAEQEECEPELANGADILGELKAWVDAQQPTVADARCGNCGSELFNPAVTA